MSTFLENRPSSPTKIGHAALVGVFCAVAIMFGARWFVAYDYASVGVGDSVKFTVTDPAPAGNQNQVTDISNGIVTVKDINGRIYKAPLEDVTEL